MPVKIPLCDDKAFLAPITVHIKDGAPQRVEFLPLGAPFFGSKGGNQIPYLIPRQLSDINQTLHLNGVVKKICQRNNGLFAAFPTAQERNERVHGSNYIIEIPSKVEAGTKVKKSERPAGEETRGVYSLTLLDWTLSYVRGEIDRDTYLAKDTKASPKDITETSRFLLREIRFGSLRSEQGKVFPNSIVHQYNKGTLYGYLDGLFGEINSNPNVARNWKEMAIAYFHGGRVTEAVAAARWAVVLDRKDPRNWQALGKVTSHAVALRGRQDSFQGEQRAVAKAEKIDAQASDNIPKTPKTESDDTEGNSTPPVATGSPQSSPALQGGSQTMADVGGFDPSEQDLFSTTSTESATFLYSVTNTTDPNVGIQMVQGSGATTLGLPMWFTVPLAARSAVGIAAH